MIQGVGLASHAPRGVLALEKWYCDVLLDDGSVLIVYLAWLRALGLRRARVAAALHAAGGPPRQGVRSVRRVELAPDAARFATSVLRLDELCFETPELWGRLTWSPRHAPVCLRDPLLSGAGPLRWVIELPDADVAGELRWPGGGQSVRGRGYRDRVSLGFAPARFPLRALRWGRGVTPGHAAAWVALEARDGAQVEAAWRDGAAVARADTAIHEERTLVDEPVASSPRLALGWTARLLRVLAGDPHETKWACRVRLAGEEGRGVHERVRW